MSPDIQLLQLDFSQQQALIKDGSLSATELAQQQLALVKQLNPAINAFISVTTTDAVTGTRGKTGLLSGLSIGVKDNIDVQGFNTTAGLEILRHNNPYQDAFVVNQLRTAGANFIGKLNMHEGALGASNHNAHYGNCYNPHKLTYTPGGSSGGSGAAVASCMTSIALGTDTMGSVRIPASYCGVFGFKPSRGAVSNRGSVVCGRVMDNIGPLARSVNDLALVYKQMVGFDAQHAESVSYEFSAELANKPVLLVPQDLTNLGIEESVQQDFQQNLQAFIDLGCEIRYFSFADYDFSAARRAGLLICEADMRVEHALAWQQSPELFSPYLRSLLSFIDRKTPMDIMASEQVLENAVVKARLLFESGDFLLMPTAPQRAFSMEQQVPANQADLTGFANQAGLPALSIPMLTGHSLPAGMQLVGNKGSDFKLLELARRWQQLTQFSYQMPAASLALIK